MAVSAKIAFVAAAAAGLLWAGAAAAQQAQTTAAAAPSERCEGTLCDWYYSARPAQPASAQGTPSTASAPATPSSSGGLMSWFGRSNGPANAQPVEPPSASNGYMSLGAGGVLGGNRGERCSGTLCDTYYGVAGKGENPKTPAGTQTAAAAEPPVAHRHIVHESETRPKCGSAQAGDPWHCFR